MPIRLDQIPDVAPSTPQSAPQGAPSALPTIDVAGTKYIPIPGKGGMRLQAIPPPAAPKISKEQDRAQINQENANVLQQHLSVIKGALAKIQTPENPVQSTVVGHLRSAAGTMDPTFQRANDDIQASIGPFITTVDGIAKGRINIVELKNMAGLIKHLPYLPPAEQAKNFAEIDAMLKKGGVPISFSGNSQGTSALAPHEDAIVKRLLGPK